MGCVDLDVWKDDRVSVGEGYERTVESGLLLILDFLHLPPKLLGKQDGWNPSP